MTVIEALSAFFTNIGLSFYNFAYAVTHPGLWLNWSDPQAVMRFIYYGASVEFFYVVLTGFLLMTIVGIWRNQFMWGVVRVFETFGNTVGRIAAWAGLLMVLQQIIIVFIQRIFARSEISIGFGVPLSFDISWWAEELKLYNALIITLCCAYTFIQGGHVRVDLVYAAVSYRAKKIIDMFGSIFFMMPMALLTWHYAWFFLWRHLITPSVAASDSYQRLVEGKYRAFKWNVETIGFSPNGFNGYFLFKILLVVFTAMVFIQAIAFFYRSYLELVEGEESEGKYLEVDRLGDETAELVHEIEAHH